MLGLSLHAAARLAQCAASYVAAIESGARRRPSEQVLTRLERALGLGPGELVRTLRWEQMSEMMGVRPGAGGDGGGDGGVGGGGGTRGWDLETQAVDCGTGGGDAVAPPPGVLGRSLNLEIPVLGGTPGRHREYVRCPDLDDPDAFALRLEDASMAPDYRPGDLVVFSPGRAARSGDDCLVRLLPVRRGTPRDGNDGNAEVDRNRRGRREVFARIYMEGGRVRLAPLNPAFPARVVRGTRVASVAPAACLIRRLEGGAGGGAWGVG